MTRAFAFCMFALDRVRTVMLALSFIVLLKIIWLLILPR
jgi:hypothetical protein